jgi:hypothetical protein
MSCNFIKNASIFSKSVYNVQKKDKIKAKFAQGFGQMLLLLFFSFHHTVFKGMGYQGNVIRS